LREVDKLELNLISKDKKSVVIEFTDVKETLVHPLVDRLLADNDVLFAAYKTGHPQLDRPKLTVKTHRVKPETAVKKAADNLSEEIKSLKKEFEKAVKKGATTKKTVPKKAKGDKTKRVIPKKKSKVDKPKKTGEKKKTKTPKSKSTQKKK
jgi:DNA-directed RNA polymerase subunit L